MARFLPVALVLALTFWVFSIVDCALQPPTRHRGVSKPAWMIIVIVIPVIGGILWFALGRTGARHRNQATFKAPDDNPEFLGSIGSIADQDERIRRLEEELAALDSDAPDPAPEKPSATPTGDGDDDPETGDGSTSGPDESPRGTLS